MFKTSRAAAVLPRGGSDAIRICRVICITSMISVHFWPGAKAISEADTFFLQKGAFSLLIDHLGRGSVPLLSAISGVLLALTAARSASTLKIVERRFANLVPPMVVWSGAMLALAVAQMVVLGDASDLPRGIMGWVNALFAITQPPANAPLGFLRDVFLASCLGLVALRLPAAWGGAWLAVLVVLEWSAGGFLFLRPQILICFAIGIALARAGLIARTPGWPSTLAVSAAAIAAGQAGGDALPWALRETLTRLPVALLIWRAGLSLAADLPRSARVLMRLEPYIFTVFCTHMITVAFVAAALRKSGITVESPIYPLVFLMQFPLVFGVAAGVYHLRQRIWPKPQPKPTIASRAAL